MVEERVPKQRSFYGEQDDSGVDISLLQYMLRLSPRERLKVMEKHAKDVATLHEYGRVARSKR